MYQPTNAKQITSAVAERLDTLKDEGLALPAHYNAQNALKAAYLRLQTVKDRQGRPALTVCTEPSIANALLDMAIQGLSPAKNQCYFIVYGNELQMQRSYFGTIAALKRLDSIEDIDAQVIHQGDEFEIGADETGHIIVTKFKPSFANLDKPIKGAFAFIKLTNGRTAYTVMTKAQIDVSWSQSRNRQNKVQDKFSDEMAKRTVINRAAKIFINTSDDSDLLTGSINAVTKAEYEEPTEPKDIMQTAAEEQGSTAKLLADFQEAQQAEEEVKTKPAPVQAPKQPVANEKPKTKEDPKVPAKTSESEPEAKPTKTNPDGHLRAEFKLADQMIQTLKNDKLFKFVYVPGEKEVIVTGKIGDHEWKGKIDSLVLNKGYFCDLKTVDDIHKKHWDAKNRRWTNFIEDRGYIMQAAIYQELIKQSFNKNCQPFIFAVSKQTPPDKGAFDFEDTDTQYLMKEALEEIKEKQDRFWQVINGEVEPKHCGKCEYCRSMKELAAFQHVTDIEVD